MKIYTDGGSKGNGSDHQVATALVMTNSTIKQYCLGNKTNNEAEVIALLAGLSVAKPGDAVLSDSRMCVEIINGNWQCKKEHLQPLFLAAKTIKKLKNITVGWIPREQNEAGIYLERSQ